MNKFIKRCLISSLALGSLITTTGMNTHAKQLNKPQSKSTKIMNVSKANHTLTQMIHKNKNIKSSQKVYKNKQFNRVLKIAKSKLGHKYCWGATGPKYFDCSGFTQYVFKHAVHKHLPRLAGSQYINYKHISQKHRQAGDLVFFGSSKHNITHVGLYLGHDKMIDAQNRGVVIEYIHVPWWHSVGYSRPVNFNK